MASQIFRAHGKFCASHPWEVIVALLTIVASMLAMEKSAVTTNQQQRNCQGWKNNCEGHEAEYLVVDVILMTVIRSSAILYSYYQFLYLNKFGSKYILVIAGLFTVFSSFIFTSTIINFLGADVSDLKDAIFFFLLLIDFSKAGMLAQLALSGSNQAEVIENISRGMQLFGPAISLDTIVETLVIGVGTMSGVHRLENVCWFAVMSVIVNYIVFMTFYPACLSLIIDLSKTGVGMAKAQAKIKDTNLLSAIFDDEQKPNPVVQRVKIIMSTGLMIVHVCSRFIFSSDSDTSMTLTPKNMDFTTSNNTESMDLSDHIMKWLKVGSDQIVILILLIALLVKFVFFEERIEPKQLNAITQVARTIEKKDLIVNVPMAKPIVNQIVRPQQQLKNQYTQTDIEKREVQTIIQHSDEEMSINESHATSVGGGEARSVDECLSIMRHGGAAGLSDDEIISIVKNGKGHCPLYKIEAIIDNPERGVRLRRGIVAREAKLPLNVLDTLSYKHFDYTKVMNVCCENVIGYVEIPVGYAGPLLLDGVKYYVPMATTEGALVASTNRGCKVLSIDGVSSFVEDIGMTRAPCVKFTNVYNASKAKRWIDAPENFSQIKTAFDATSRFARLQDILITIDGPQLYIRFRALTGDAMGMNMVSKGAESALRYIQKFFPDMQIISLSGNFCSDKKPAAVNWIRGRGKRVVAECIVKARDLKTILKTDAKTLVQCNKLKNLAGSAMAGSIGGNNAHAANMVTAIYIACGQDPAQNVTSSNCSTGMECCGDSNEDLYLTCTMPSLEVGTVGGGTGLPGQSACLDMLGVRGSAKSPADNSKKLAQIICATVMAGELSLMAALVNSDLVKSHMIHNRTSVAAANAVTPCTHPSTVPHSADCPTQTQDNNT